jgi:hypothetical protein
MPATLMEVKRREEGSGHKGDDLLFLARFHSVGHDPQPPIGDYLPR